jgi:hypothetical protein
MKHDGLASLSFFLVGMLSYVAIWPIYCQHIGVPATALRP